MAYTKEGFLGNFKGQLANTVVYEMYGKTVIRSKPAYKRRPAKGALKQAQTDFSHVMKIMQAVRSVIRLGFRDVAEGRSAFHTAMSVNLVNYRNAETPEDMRWLLVSQGERAGALDLAVEVQDTKAIITWGDPEPGKPHKMNDQVLLLAINNKTLQNNEKLQAARRSENQAEINLPPIKEGENFLVFIAFYNPFEALAKKSPNNFSKSQVIG